VLNRQTILVSGGTDTGKTTFAKALLDYIPQHERIGVIEDTIELKIDHPNVFRFEARKEQKDSSGNTVIPAVTIRDLVKATLRHRPDRLIIGEVRGGEAFDLLDALNTGHSGSNASRQFSEPGAFTSRKSCIAQRCRSSLSRYSIGNWRFGKRGRSHRAPGRTAVPVSHSRRSRLRW
jgi:pilus assembly protein CpaF